MSDYNAVKTAFKGRFFSIGQVGDWLRDNGWVAQERKVYLQEGGLVVCVHDSSLEFRVSSILNVIDGRLDTRQAVIDYWVEQAKRVVA